MDELKSESEHSESEDGKSPRSHKKDSSPKAAAAKSPKLVRAATKSDASLSKKGSMSNTGKFKKEDFFPAQSSKGGSKGNQSKDGDSKVLKETESPNQSIPPFSVEQSEIFSDRAHEVEGTKPDPLEKEF